MSEEARDTLIGLLLSIRDPEKYDKIQSDHDRKHAYKTFLKKLVARSERKILAATVNPSAIADNGSVHGTGKAKIDLQLKGDEQKGSKDDANVNKDKVRIVLVEANFLLLVPSQVETIHQELGDEVTSISPSILVVGNVAALDLLDH